MKIGVYDKWLNAFGGGEKVATVMAEVLSKNNHEVDLISNFEVEKAELEEKMGVDLSKVKMVFWPERSYEKLDSETEKYDLFINVSFFDHLPSKAKKSVYYIHFPTPIKRSLWGLVKYETILPFLRRFLIIPEVTRGLRYIDEVIVRGGKWLSKENTLVFSNPPRKFVIKLRVYAEKLTLASLNSISFDSPNSKVGLQDKYIDHANNVLTYRLAVSSVNDSSFILNIHNSNSSFQSSMGLVSMTITNIRYLLWNYIKRYLPTYEMALYGSRLYKPAAGLSTYNLFLANSQFTREWTKKYWGRDSSILYPPVDVEKFKPGVKKNIILNVGRFFISGHSKKQDVLIKVFKEMVDKDLLDQSWELHLAGGLAEGAENKIFFESLLKEAEGYPIYFHISISYKELKSLYSQARVYWHASGYGQDESKNPGSFEHFGITVVEAMSSGCVPVVFLGGGLSETVGNDKRMLWNNTDELMANTKSIVDNEKLMINLSKTSQARAKQFSKGEFAKRLVEYIKQLNNV